MCVCHVAEKHRFCSYLVQTGHEQYQAQSKMNREKGGKGGWHKRTIIVGALLPLEGECVGLPHKNEGEVLGREHSTLVSESRG